MGLDTPLHGCVMESGKLCLDTPSSETLGQWIL